MYEYKTAARTKVHMLKHIATAVNGLMHWRFRIFIFGNLIENKNTHKPILAIENS